MTQKMGTGRKRRRAWPHISRAARLIGIAFWGLSADGGGGAGQGQTEDDDRDGGEDVQDAVQLDRHGVVPFFSFGGPEGASPMWTMLR